MIIKIKHLGVINRFNGVDIHQTRNYIKVNTATYINKIIEDKILLSEPQHVHPLPMNPDTVFNCQIEKATPLTDSEQCIEKEYGLSYHQGIGELIYAMVTCRPDISFPLIKLSQYSAKPAEIHFVALRQLYCYLRDTPTEGIYYWH